MKLSEAILLGGSLHKQCTGSWFKTETEDVTVCGLGAASSAIEEFDPVNMVAPWCVKQEELNRRIKVMSAKYPFIFVYHSVPPFKIGGGIAITYSSVGQAIVHMNDCLRWSLEKIAAQIAEWEKEHPEWYESTESGQNTLQTECPQESFVSS